MSLPFEQAEQDFNISSVSSDETHKEKMDRKKEERESNMLDGGAHFYDTYKCKDGKFLSVGAIEPQFYSVLLEKLEISDPDFQEQMNREKWPELKAIMKEKMFKITFFS